VLVGGIAPREGFGLVGGFFGEKLNHQPARVRADADHRADKEAGGGEVEGAVVDLVSEGFGDTQDLGRKNAAGVVAGYAFEDDSDGEALEHGECVLY
jgi:hypothetical protein